MPERSQAEVVDASFKSDLEAQAIQGIKQLMSKTVQDERETSAEELLSIAVATFNQRDLVRGFSPTQHVLGVNPDTTGSYVQLPEGREQEPVLNNPAEEFKREARLRAEAEKSLAEWNAQQRIQRALNSRTRPDNTYYPGDLVYFWRTQESNKSKKQPGTNQGRFLGPARVLAMETRKDDAGQRRPAHAIWCVRGRSLIKCSPEQLRLASQREELIEALSEKEATPWTFTRLAEEVGGNQYQDVSNEIPTVEEWARAQDPTQEAPPRRYRIVAKRPQTEMSPGDQEMPEDLESGTSQPSSLRRVEPQEPQHGLHTQASHWRDEVRQSAWVAEQTCFWTDSGAAVEVEVAVPESRRGLDSMTRDMQSYFVGALKRKAVEVSERRLSPADRERFQEAKGVEVKNFIAAQAFEALPEHLKPNREQAVGMRWILTWKVKEDGSVKPKARAVLLGYQDPGYEHRATTAPVMTRQTRQLMLQLAANKHWRLMKGDVSGAFLQGRTYPTELYCVPCDEICQAMGINPGSITRLKKACYGLVDAPLEWYKTVANFFSSLGLEKLWIDRVCRSPGAAETAAAVNGEDMLYYVRYQWSEMIYGKVDLRHPNKTVSKVPGYVITDSRNVYDKLATAMFSVNGAEKKANIELMGLKEAQEATGVIMRWVHSEAQLANALTKAQQHRELELYYRMQHQWRIVEDTEMKSARKRKNEGLEPLQ
ncbi:Copia protein [Symbiodinium microadriaticum]|uniref:Copia protein n=1 Tax=Symbiodinium microadriaticum TaxID=2951 RepID=A0A1Q9CZQ9_SYMMI|nr:Copia protein [Symbiodinium microadriaticum]